MSKWPSGEGERLKISWSLLTSQVRSLLYSEGAPYRFYDFFALYGGTLKNFLEYMSEWLGSHLKSGEYVERSIYLCRFESCCIHGVDGRVVKAAASRSADVLS